jgi:hypothetical protein
VSAVLLVRRDGLDGPTRVVEEPPEPGPGAVLVEVEAVALTANTLTYGLVGDALGHWDVRPVDRPGMGCLPAWGTGVVRRSRCPELPAGQRLSGLLALAEHCVLTPTRVSPAAFRDASPHRRGLPRPTATTSGCPPRRDPPRRAAPGAAAPAVRAGLPARRAAVRAPRTGPGDQRVEPHRPGPRPAGRPGRPPGRRAHLARARRRLPPARRCWSTWPGAPRCAGGSGRRPGAAAVLVGATHRAGPALHPEPGERVFSAVDRLRTATAELGAAELDRRQQRAWREYLDRCGRAVVPRLDRERAAVERTYREVRDGRCPPGHAHLVSIR